MSLKSILFIWFLLSVLTAVNEKAKDFELVWLQEEDRLNIKFEHFLLLTFCRDCNGILTMFK